ncbi:MAG: cytochrome c3 family protein [bacterium]
MLQTTLHRPKLVINWIASNLGVILLSILSCTYKSEQPINFNHKTHFQYFINGTHKKANFQMHEDLLGEIPEELQSGECLDCHGSFEEAIEDTPRIKDCAGCHQIFLETDLRERPAIRPCVGCHRNAIQGHNASIPNIEVCVACHKEAITEDPEEDKLLVYINNDKRINWIRVNNNLTGDTHFSHERHVAVPEVDCRDCHGRVDEAPMSLGLRMNLKMETCMDCHEKMIADNDCLACHY